MFPPECLVFSMPLVLAYKMRCLPNLVAGKFENLICNNVISHQPTTLVRDRLLHSDMIAWPSKTILCPPLFLGSSFRHIHVWLESPKRFFDPERHPESMIRVLSSPALVVYHVMSLPC